MPAVDLKALRASSAQAGERNDCTVMALAVTTGLEYDRVHAALAAEGRKPRRGTSIFNMQRAAESLGFEMKQTSEFSARTVRTAARDRRLQSGRFILNTSGHVAGLVDGKVHDWTDGRLHRIRSVFTVTRVKPAPQIEEQLALAL